MQFFLTGDGVWKTGHKLHKYLSSINLRCVPSRFRSGLPASGALSPFSGPIESDSEAHGAGDARVRRAGPILSFAPMPTHPGPTPSTPNAPPGKSAPGVASQQSVVAELVRTVLDDARTVLRPGWPRSMDPAPGSTGEACGTVAPSDCFALAQADLERIDEMMGLLRRVMFPGYFDPAPVPTTPEDLQQHVSHLCGLIAGHLERALRAVFRYSPGAQSLRPGSVGRSGAGGQTQSESHSIWSEQPLGKAEERFSRDVVGAFMARLPEVRRLLSLDVQASYDGDPAAEHTDEVILCYPGLDAIFSHRVAHELYNLDVPLLPRIISERAHSRTGIDIHPGAQIGRSFFIDHGSGTVIGETSVIGEHVKIYQGVTLGARSFPKDERGRVIRGIKRHPTIGNRVNIYAGAVILGGDTVIGDDCVIAGGVFVTSSVPPGHVVQQPRADLTLRPNAPATAASSGAKASGQSHGGAQANHAHSSPSSPSAHDPDLHWLADGAGI